MQTLCFHQWSLSRSRSQMMPHRKKSLNFTHIHLQISEARLTNNLWTNRDSWTTSTIPDLCSFHSFTKLKPKPFVTGPFIGFGMSPWLLGTDSGSTQPSRISY